MIVLNQVIDGGKAMNYLVRVEKDGLLSGEDKEVPCVCFTFVEGLFFEFCKTQIKFLKKYYYK